MSAQPEANPQGAVRCKPAYSIGVLELKGKRVAMDEKIGSPRNSTTEFGKVLTSLF